MSDPVDPGDIDLNVAFGATSQFGATTGQSAPLAGWNPQDPTITETKQVATTANDVGDVTDAKEYDVTTETVQSYKAAQVAATDLPSDVGSMMAGNLVTKIVIKTSATDFVTMELTGHNHAVNAHSANSDHRKMDIDVELSSGFGAHNFLGATLGDNAAIESSEITFEVQHTDIVAGMTGSHFAGNNYQGHVTCTQTFRGTPTTPVDTTVWTVIPNKATAKKQTDYDTVTVTAERWIALDV